MDSSTAQSSARRRWRVVAASLALPCALGAVVAGWWWAGRGDTWFALAIRSPWSVRSGAILLLGTLLLSVVGGAMVKLGRRPPRASLSRDQTGVAVLEFVLLFPIATAIVLVMIQSALLMAGNLLVHYGAYCAARSAIVWIPADLDDREPHNVVASPDTSTKLRRIRQAAVLGILPAGPRSGRWDSPAQTEALRRVLAGLYARSDTDPGGWIDGPLAARYTYVNDEDHTWIELSEPTHQVTLPADDALDGMLDGRYDNGTGIDPYGPTEPITVTLHHRLHLAVPYANRLFGRELTGRSGQYATEIAVSYTLMNQGRYDGIIVETMPGDGTTDVVLPR